MTKNSEARCSIINKVAKAVSLLSYCDKTTIIDKNTAAAAIPVLCKLKPEIVRLLPKYNTKRVRNGIKTHKDALVALREIIRLQNKAPHSIETNVTIPGSEIINLLIQQLVLIMNQFFFMMD